MAYIDELFVELDRRWTPAEVHKRELRLIGSGALMAQLDDRRGTKDGDVFETLELTPDVQRRMLQIAGSGSEIHRRLRLYVQIVSSGIPFLPRAPCWHPLPFLDARLASFTVVALDVVDVVVSKLKRFSSTDREDIEAMIDGQHVPHARFVERFRSAVDEFAHDARAADLPGYIANFNEIERDVFVTDETEIELPSWV